MAIAGDDCMIQFLSPYLKLYIVLAFQVKYSVGAFDLEVYFLGILFAGHDDPNLTEIYGTFRGLLRVEICFVLKVF